MSCANPCLDHHRYSPRVAHSLWPSQPSYTYKHGTAPIVVTLRFCMAGGGTHRAIFPFFRRTRPGRWVPGRTRGCPTRHRDNCHGGNPSNHLSHRLTDRCDSHMVHDHNLPRVWPVGVRNIVCSPKTLPNTCLVMWVLWPKYIYGRRLFQPTPRPSLPPSSPSHLLFLRPRPIHVVLRFVTASFYLCSPSRVLLHPPLPLSFST